MTRTLGAVLTAVAVGTYLVHLAAAQPQSSLEFLRTELAFSAGDLRELAPGRAVVRSLDTSDPREIAIAGAVRVALSPSQYIAELRDIVAFKKHEAVVQIGTFGRPPRVEDLANLTLDTDHLEDLEDCRVFDCDFQLPRDAIQRVRQAVRWSDRTAARDDANRIIRAMLTDLVARYLAQGDAALMTYEDERPPVDVAAEFQSLISAPPAVLRQFPALERHIAAFPRARTPAAEDLIYWSKEDIGPQVIISVTHMVIAPVETGPVVYAAASKQLYGSHYFDSSLGLTLLLRDDQPSSTVLVYINRSRVDALDGFLGGLKRAIVRSRARAAMEDTLTRIRTRLPARVGRNREQGFRD